MTKTTLSPTVLSQNMSPAPTPDFSLITTKSTIHNSPCSKRTLPSSLPHQDKRPFYDPPTMTRPSLCAPNALQLPPINPPSIIYPQVNQTRFIPKMLLNPLDLGDEIQWARLNTSYFRRISIYSSEVETKSTNTTSRATPSGQASY